VAADIDVALWHTDVVMHVPIQKAHAARDAAREAGIDLIVCVGGGSTTGLAKAVALETGIPIIAVPTTYAGSEATNVWGLTESAR
jgi:maleylacetate reductase